MPPNAQPVVSDVSSIPYHHELTECLKRQEDGLWEWFSSDELTEHANRDARLYLLKNAVRLGEDDHPELHALAREIAEALGIAAPVTLYQGNNGGQRNAILVRMNSEVAIFFGGDILSFLSEEEQRALLAHEMAHFLFKSVDGGSFEITDNLLSWINGVHTDADVRDASSTFVQLHSRVYDLMKRAHRAPHLVNAGRARHSREEYLQVSPFLFSWSMSTGKCMVSPRCGRIEATML